MAAAVCAFDSGSATGCRPVCDAPATVVMTYGGYRGPYAVPLCAGHVPAMRARVWPYPVHGVTPYPGNGATRTCLTCALPVTYEQSYGWRAAHWNRCTTADGRHTPELART